MPSALASYLAPDPFCDIGVLAGSEPFRATKEEALIAETARAIKISPRSIVAKELSLDRKIPITISVPNERITKEDDKSFLSLSYPKVISILLAAVNSKQISSTKVISAFNGDPDIFSKLEQLAKVREFHYKLSIPITRNLSCNKVSMYPEALIDAAKTVVKDFSYYGSSHLFKIVMQREAECYEDQELAKITRGLKIATPENPIAKTLSKPFETRPITFTIDSELHLEPGSTTKSTSLKLHPYKLLSIVQNAIKDGSLSATKVFSNEIQFIKNKLEKLKQIFMYRTPSRYQDLEATVDKNGDFITSQEALIYAIQAFISKLQ